MRCTGLKAGDTHFKSASEVPSVPVLCGGGSAENQERAMQLEGSDLRGKQAPNWQPHTAARFERENTGRRFTALLERAHPCVFVFFFRAEGGGWEEFLAYTVTRSQAMRGMRFNS